jgi:hypothetical protein
MKIDRRKFLKNFGIGSLIVALAGQVYTWFRSLFPNVSYESVRRIKLDEPDKIPDGVTFIDDLRTYIFREGKTFMPSLLFALILVARSNMSRFQSRRSSKLAGKKLKSSGNSIALATGQSFMEMGQIMLDLRQDPLIG